MSFEHDLENLTISTYTSLHHALKMMPPLVRRVRRIAGILVEWQAKSAGLWRPGDSCNDLRISLLAPSAALFRFESGLRESEHVSSRSPIRDEPRQELDLAKMDASALLGLLQVITACGQASSASASCVKALASYRSSGSTKDNLTVDIAHRCRGAVKLSGDPEQAWVRNRVGSFSSTNMNLVYSMDRSFGRAEVFLNVHNLFDQEAPPANFYSTANVGSSAGFVSGDDPIGRYYTVGVRMRV